MRSLSIYAFIMGLVLGLATVTLFTVTPSADAATTERTWLVLGQEYNLTGTVDGHIYSIEGAVKVEPGEVVTINWWNVTNLTGHASGNNYVKITTHIPPLNWSSNLTVNPLIVYDPIVHTYKFWNDTSGSAWLRGGGYDVVSVDMEWMCGYNSSTGKTYESTISFNITVMQDNYTFAPNTKALEDKISELENRISHLQDELNASGLNISEIQTLISELQTSQDILNTDITTLRGLISDLQALVNQQNLSNSENNIALREELATLNA